MARATSPAVSDPRPPKKLDGLGEPINPTALYYVQDKRTFVGNCALWWRPDGAGYTCDIDDAGTYVGDKVSRRETDVAWPVDYVLSRIIRHVRGDLLGRVQS